MKIRHVLPGDNLYACYIMKKAPYGATFPLVHQALVTREGEDEIIGFIANGRIVPADVVGPDTRFLGYQSENVIPSAQYRAQLTNWGQKWEESLKPAPEQVQKLWAEGDEVPEGVGQS